MYGTMSCRTLIRIRDYMTKLENKSCAKRFRRLIFANTTKDDLAAFRRDLMDAHMVFMVGLMTSIRVLV